MLTFPSSILRPGDRVCCAVSGGADSVALLLLLQRANTLPRNALGVGLSAVHVHHNLRAAEADADQRFVVELCEHLGVPLHLASVDTAARAASERETVEEAARNLRYEVFRGLLAEGRATHVLTAHTLDDQAETVLMKLLRGAWLEGLSAISPVLEERGGRIVRPLLQTTRAELRAYLAAEKQNWREDSSNADESFTRNRLRHRVLPLLREENPAIDRTLANLAELAREEETRWAGEMSRLLPRITLPGSAVRGGGRANPTGPGEQMLAVELERLRELDPALRRRVIRALAQQLGARLDFAETGRVLALAGLEPSGIADPTVPSRPGAVLKLSQNLVVQRTVRELRLSISGRAAGGNG